MKSSETDILIIAGYEGAGPDHWQSRIVKKLPFARMVEQEDWLYGSLDVAVDTLVKAVAEATKPVVFVAHSVGCTLIAHAMPKMKEQGLTERLRGGYLVVPPSEEALAGFSGIDPRFKQIPRDPLPFPSLFIVSSNDPFSTMEQSADLANAWGSELVEAGEQGHINAASGHGPWPEGLMRFAGFLSKLK